MSSIKNIVITRSIDYLKNLFEEKFLLEEQLRTLLNKTNNPNDKSNFLNSMYNLIDHKTRTESDTYIEDELQATVITNNEIEEKKK